MPQKKENVREQHDFSQKSKTDYEPYIGTSHINKHTVPAVNKLWINFFIMFTFFFLSLLFSVMSGLRAL